jgi:hypothetical protein
MDLPNAAPQKASGVRLKNQTILLMIYVLAMRRAECIQAISGNLECTA